MNVFLFIHVVIAILLIVVILLQRSGTDGVSGLSGGSNMGVVSGKSVNNFLTKTTIILATLFLVNALILANLSSKKNPEIAKKIDQMSEENANEEEVPIAK